MNKCNKQIKTPMDSGDNKSDSKELSKDNKRKAMGYHRYLLEHLFELQAAKKVPDCWTLDLISKTFTGYDCGEGAITFLHTNEDGRGLNIKWHKSEKGKRPRGVRGHNKIRLYPQHLTNEDGAEPLFFGEGEKDCLTLLAHNISAVTLTTGADSVRADLSLIRNHKDITIIYDNDAAGRKGAIKLAEILLEACPEANIYIFHWPANLPNGFDVTDFFQGDGTSDSFKKMVRENRTLFQSELPQAKRPMIPSAENTFQPRINHELLTDSLKLYLQAVSSTTDAPDEFLVVSALPIWAGIVGHQLMGPNNLRSNIWVTVFADSGLARKSTALKIARHPAALIQQEGDVQFRKRLAPYEKELKKWEKDEGDETSKPRRPTPNIILLPVDFSDAGFYQMLKDNGAAGVIIASEFSDFHSKLHRKYTSQADAFLNAYDNERMTRMTRMHGMETIEEPTFSILGATTFQSFKNVFKASELENGFFQRIFPVALAAPTKERLGFLQRSEVEPAYVKSIQGKMRDWIERNSTMKVTISDDVKEEFDTWEMNFVEASKSSGERWIAPHIERLVPGVLKLAMLLESMEVKSISWCTEITISSKTLHCAIMLIENIFLPSIRYLRYEILFSGTDLTLEKKIENALMEAGGSIARSELTRSIRSSKYALDETLFALESKNLIQTLKEDVQRDQGGGAPVTTISWVGDH